MRRCWLLLLLAVPGLAGPDTEGTVRDEELNFAVSMPDSIDWEKVPLGDNKAVKAHFKTEFADSDPPAVAEVQLIVVPLRKEFATATLENVAKRWADSMEASLGNTRDLKEATVKLGGQDAYQRDLKGDYISGIGHITWTLTRMGEHLYVLWAIRTFKAVDDVDVEEELQEIRDSFKFLKVIEVKASKKATGKEGDPAGPGGAGAGAKDEDVDPEQIKKEKLELDHWRLEIVKPEGLFNVKPEDFEQSEKDNNVVAKFMRRGGQTYILIRVYAQIDKAQRYTIQQLAERNMKSFETIYEEKNRLPPEIDNDHKKFPPLAKECIYMKLVGRRTVPETTIWYLAQCKNDRQYQIQIYITGATGEKDWEQQVKDFLKGFKPQKK